MVQTVCHQIQLSRSAGTAKIDFPQGKDPRLKQQKLDLEQACGEQYITLGGGSTRASGRPGYAEAVLKDINETDKEIILFLQMTNGNGYQAGLAGIMKVDRSRIRNDRDLEIVGDENEINYDQEYYSQILMDGHGEYRIPVVPVEGTRVNFNNIAPYNKTKPLGWNAKRFSCRMVQIPNQQQMVELKYLLQ